MKTWKLFCLAVLSGMFFSGPALAADPAVNVGVIENIAVPDTEHLGVYPYVSGSLVISPRENVLIVPGVGFEYSPEFNRWGFVGTLVFDYAFSESVGFDIVTTILHDQTAADFDDALWFLGIGPGMTFVTESVAISPSVSLYRGLTAPGWSVVPGLNVALPL